MSTDQLVHHEPIDEPDSAQLTVEERTEAKVGPQSPLSLLQGKRQELERELFYDLQIPRWDQILGRALWVRFKPASAPLLDAAINRRRENHERATKAGKMGDPDWLIRANADMLVDACIAVYDLALGEEPPTEPLPENLPTFASSELSEALDTPGNPCPRNAVGTCLHLYGTSSDVLMASQQLLLWSGQASKEADRSFLTQ
jgi:hypothetical protein